MITKYNSTE